jgi:hypothetical protein
MERKGRPHATLLFVWGDYEHFPYLAQGSHGCPQTWGADSIVIGQKYLQSMTL